MTTIYNMHVCRCVIFHATAAVKGNNLEFQILCQNALTTVKTRSLVVKGNNLDIGILCQNALTMVKTRKDVRVREVAASWTENPVLSHRKPCQLSLTSSISTSGFSVLVFLRHWISFPGMAPTYVRLHNRPPPSVLNRSYGFTQSCKHHAWSATST